MFNDKPYSEVNREERFFCFLLAHALLASPEVRAGFVCLVNRKFHTSLHPNNLEVYLETAVLRDYWHDLGDPRKYTQETHLGRESVIASVLNMFGFRELHIQQHPLFWTSQSRVKLRYPGRWNEQELETAGFKKLIKVKWAFNAKPDIMLVSGTDVLLVEAKVESREGSYSGGVKQTEIQVLIGCLLKLLAPQFRDSSFVNIVMGLSPTAGISWQKILEITDKPDIDPFTKHCLSQLRRYYRHSGTPQC